MDTKQNTVFCKAPWVHLENDPSGVFMPCCTYFTSLGKVEDGWKKAWNGEAMQKLRKGFLEFDPKYIGPCKHCIAYEKFGMSQRQLMNWYWNRANYSELSLESDQKPVFLDLRFSTACNFACIMCGPHASSRWSKELGLKSLSFDCSNLVQTVKDCLPNLQRIHFAGGEPLILKEHKEILDFLVDVKRFDIELTYNTNLSVIFPELWKQFKKVSICISIDAVGPKNDYIRFGGNWVTLQNNIQKLLQYPNLDLSIHPTFTVLNIMEALELYRYGKNKGIPIIWGNFAEGPEWLDIRNFPDRIKDFVLKSLVPLNQEEQELVKLIQNQVVTGTESEGIVERFYGNVDTIDKRRGTDWKFTFPELQKILL